jgi:peptidoglycan hydrolase-like protein with peptidoglycan-binding domain
MSFSLIWLAQVLKDAGLKVAPVQGWETRGRAEMGEVMGIICHHTAGPLKGNMPSLTTLINGTPSLPGPLSQLGIGRDGTFYLVAAGRCNHAGTGIWKGITSGNTHFIGIEAENTGLPNDFPWPQVQLEAYQRGVAAILQHIGKDVSFCAAHKEYATPKGRKMDPDFDMNAFRMAVSDIMDGTTPAPVLIPRADITGRPTLRRGAMNDFVKTLQQKLNIVIDGTFGPNTEAAVREFQRQHQLIPDGIVGPVTWKIIDLL